MKERIFGLDIIRAISIWMVLVYHLGFHISEMPIINIGGAGVEVFFVISGFLIGQILIRDLEKSNSIKSIINFWVRRWMRILPLYYLILAIKYFLYPYIGWNIIYYFLFLQNNFYGIDFFGVSWSLVIEEWFYLIAPFVLLIAYKVGRHKKMAVLILVLLFMLLVLFGRFWYASRGVPFSGVNSQFIFRLDSLFIGVVLAFLKINFEKFYEKLVSLKVVLVGIFLFLLYLFYIKYLGKEASQYLFPKTVGFLIFSLIIGLILPFFDGIKTINTGSMWRKLFYHFITRTSIYTYAIYLVHMEIFSRTKSILGINTVSNIVALIITYIFAHVLYKYWEHPFLKLRKVITKK